MASAGWGSYLLGVQESNVGVRTTSQQSGTTDTEYRQNAKT